MHKSSFIRIKNSIPTEIIAMFQMETKFFAPKSWKTISLKSTFETIGKKKALRRAL
jgi:hypothetical protein